MKPFPHDCVAPNRPLRHKGSRLRWPRPQKTMNALALLLTLTLLGTMTPTLLAAARDANWKKVEEAIGKGLPKTLADGFLHFFPVGIAGRGQESGGHGSEQSQRQQQRQGIHCLLWPRPPQSGPLMPQGPIRRNTIMGEGLHRSSWLVENGRGLLPRREASSL